MTASDDGTARVWDPRLEPELTPIVKASAPLQAARLSPDGSRIVVAGPGATATIRDAATGRVLRSFSLPGRAADAAFGPDGRLVAIAAGSDGRARRRSQLRAPATVDSVSVAAGRPDRGGDRAWHRAALGCEGRARARDPRGRRSGPVYVAFSPDGKRIATATRDGVARIWNADTGKLELTLRGHHGPLTSARFSPDGSQLVTASFDHDARLWDARTGALLHVLRGHFAVVSDAEFSPDGRWVVTAGPTTAGLWDARSGQLVFFLRGHSARLTSATFDPVEQPHRHRERGRNGAHLPLRRLRRARQPGRAREIAAGALAPRYARRMPEFRTTAAYRPTGDQPAAIETLAPAILAGERYTTLLGATGTGKTATMAWLIEKVQKPTLIIAHNKTLAAQLCNEFREFFPDNAVEYFVSYYDYYQPEAYVPQADLYIEKDSSRNDDIDRLRHAATAALLSRRDVVIIASVSAIYGLGSPDEYRDRVLELAVGEEHDRDEVLRTLVDSQYARNDTVLGRGRFRVKGDQLEVQPANGETAYRVSFFGDEVEQITHFDPMTGEVLSRLDNLTIFPATQYVTSKPTIERAVATIQSELEAQVKMFESEDRLLEAHRIRQRTEYDLEMMRELGFCNGIENYSRILEGRAAGSHPFTLLDYFPSDFVCFIDESHQTVPQIGGMYEGDRSRKQTLVDFGFRLPSALDNRPLRFDEFLSKVPQLVFVSATPGAYELRHSTVVAEQLIRPTGIIDPEVELRATENQIDDLLNEIRRREEANERVLVTTLTKKMSEDLTDYLLESGVKARYLHSEVDTLERIQIIRELRLGEYDVLVGVNLLREGLDLPEVSLVAVLDADKEGFLRGKTALIQTIGRAARNINGKVLLYADKMTEALTGAIGETDRRRAIQLAYNEEHGITPETIIKGVSDIAEFLTLESPTVPGRRRRGQSKVEGMSREELEKLVVTLEEEMFAAATELRFEYAAKLRDEIKELRRELQALAQSAA